jgi:hypothetical protein
MGSQCTRTYSICTAYVRRIYSDPHEACQMPILKPDGQQTLHQKCNF